MKWSRILYLVLLVMIAAFLYAMFFGQTESSDTVHITQVAELAQEGQIQKITVSDDTLEIELDNGDIEITATILPIRGNADGTKYVPVRYYTIA